MAASTYQLAERIVSEGQLVGYLGLQHPQHYGVAVFESVGPAEHKHLGPGGSTGRTRWRSPASMV